MGLCPGLCTTQKGGEGPVLPFVGNSEKFLSPSGPVSQCVWVKTTVRLSSTGLVGWGLGSEGSYRLHQNLGIQLSLREKIKDKLMLFLRQSHTPIREKNCVLFCEEC